MIDRYIDHVRHVDCEAYARGQVDKSLVLWEDGRLRMDYAPFDHVPSNAQLAIVGLTPGRVQAANALRKFKSEIESGASKVDAMRAAKSFASFSGTMRSSLVAMLDEIGIPRAFGHARAEDFFRSGNELVHFTSTLRYPVYSDNNNYSGSPPPMSSPTLREVIDQYLASEALALPDAVWVPLGKHAETALLNLSERGLLDRNRILSGLPHPSGANAERIAYFLGRKERSRLSSKTNASKIDTAKTALLRQVAALD